MKNCFMLLLILFAKTSFAQNNSGIYMNWQDYKNDKLSFACNCDSSNSKVKLHHFFSKDYIDIIQNGKTIRLSKDSLFGYRDCEQKDYRFFKACDKEYRIVENKTIVIYTADEPVTSTTGKTIQLVPAFFFSKTLNAVILPLTVSNLKRVFPDNLKLHDMLDVQLNSEKDISSFDDYHKMYKINNLLNQITN